MGGNGAGTSTLLRVAGEALLEGFPGTLLIASHDRRLVARLATQVWRFSTKGGLDGCTVVPT